MNVFENLEKFKHNINKKIVTEQIQSKNKTRQHIPNLKVL